MRSRLEGPHDPLAPVANTGLSSKSVPMVQLWFSASEQKMPGRRQLLFLIPDYTDKNRSAWKPNCTMGCANVLCRWHSLFFLQIFTCIFSKKIYYISIVGNGSLKKEQRMAIRLKTKWTGTILVKIKEDGDSIGERSVTLQNRALLVFILTAYSRLTGINRFRRNRHEELKSWILKRSFFYDGEGVIEVERKDDVY